MLEIQPHIKSYKLYKEITLARCLNEPYIFYDDKEWCYGMSGDGIWQDYIREGIEETSWLEVLILTGTSQQQAFEIWYRAYEDWEKKNKRKSLHGKPVK